MFLQKTEAKVESEPEKNQGRYNLRRRKDDGDAKSAEARPEQLEEEAAKRAAAPSATLSTPLDFGGKIGRLQEMLLHVRMQLIAYLHSCTSPLLLKLLKHVVSETW